MKRRYFIIDLPNEHVINALRVRLGITVFSTYNEDRTKVSVKTTENLISNSGKSLKTLFQKGFSTEYTFEEWKVIVNGWSNEEV